MLSQFAFRLDSELEKSRSDLDVTSEPGNTEITEKRGRRSQMVTQQIRVGDRLGVFRALSLIGRHNRVWDMVCPQGHHILISPKNAVLFLGPPLTADNGKAAEQCHHCCDDMGVGHRSAMWSAAGFIFDGRTGAFITVLR